MLTSLVERVSGARGAVFCDHEGESVEVVIRDAALSYLHAAQDLDSRDPLLLDPDGLEVEEPSQWGGVVTGPGHHRGGLELDADRPDLRALVRYARHGASN